jgi:hypothetical protein
LWRQDLVAGTTNRYDELYTYDAAQRLATAARGVLNSSHDAIAVIAAMR